MLEGTSLYVIAACVVGAIVLLTVVACKSGCCGEGASGSSGNTSRNAAAKARQQYQQLPRVSSHGNPALVEEGKLQQMTPLRSTATSANQAALSTSSAQLRTTQSEVTVRAEPEHSPLSSAASNAFALPSPPTPPSPPSPPPDAPPQDSPHRMALHRSNLSAGVFEKLTASTRKLLEDAETEFGSFDPADLEQHEPIAQGSQATVFAGTLHHKDYRGQITKVAIKAYSGLALTNKQTTRDLMAELNALKRLNDFKHILHFYGIVISDNQLKTVLEWCQGTIDKLTEGHPLHEKIHLLAQAASAVHYLHSQQPPVLHGDIKPENILVSESFQVRVGDFATSRILDNARPSEKDSRFRGTPVYLPPEMFNLNEMGLEGDIYAFGVTAWEVLTEQKAWQDMRMGRIMLAVSEGQRPDVSMLPTQLQVFLGDTWAQDPTARLSSWSLWTRSLQLAVLSALDNSILLNGQPGHLRLMQLRGPDDESASTAEQCIFVSADAAVAQRGVQPDVPRFLSSMLGFFNGEERASIDRSSQVEKSLAELFGIVFV